MMIVIMVMMIMVKMTMNSQGPPSQEAPPPGHSRGQVSQQSPFSSGSGKCPRSLGAFRPRGHNHYELITTRAHICHKYHKLYLWRKIVIWRKFGEILGIFRHFGKFSEILPHFTRFLVETN